MASAAIAIRCQPRSSGFLIARLHVPWATAALDPWQRDLPSVDAPTFKDMPRSVRSQFDACPISMQFKQSAAVDGPQQTGATGRVEKAANRSTNVDPKKWLGIVQRWHP